MINQYNMLNLWFRYDLKRFHFHAAITHDERIFCRDMHFWHVDFVVQIKRIPIGIPPRVFISFFSLRDIA